MIHNRHLKISPKSLLVITYSEGMRRVFQEQFKDYTEANYLCAYERKTPAMYLCFCHVFTLYGLIHTII